MTVMELAHGAVRANTPHRKTARQQFIHELMAAIPVHPVSASVALRAGQIDGESAARGVTLPLSDLLIAVTALELGYRVATVSLPGMCVTSRPFPASLWLRSKLKELFLLAAVLSCSSDPLQSSKGRTSDWSSASWLQPIPGKDES